MSRLLYQLSYTAEPLSGAYPEGRLPASTGRTPHGVNWQTEPPYGIEP